jgi:hypothetical protein
VPKPCMSEAGEDGILRRAKIGREMNGWGKKRIVPAWQARCF